MTTGTLSKERLPSLTSIFCSCSKRMSITIPFELSTGNAVIEYRLITSCADATSLRYTDLGLRFIRRLICSCRFPVLISQRRISPSVTTPSSFCCSLVTNKIPLALRSMRCIASTTVLSGDIKNNANCSVFIWEPPCFFFRFLQENVLFFYLP